MSMASVRTTFTLDSELAERARRLNINISAAARAGVSAAVMASLAEADRTAYEQTPEHADRSWDRAEAWSGE